MVDVTFYLGSYTCRIYNRCYVKWVGNFVDMGVILVKLVMTKSLGNYDTTESLGDHKSRKVSW